MARIISKQTLDDIRFANDIAEVIGGYITLKRAGSNFKALCPFHKEKTPSFHVNPQRQIFHCFGCGAGGDVFSFVMNYEGVDFVTAAKMLAQRAGIVLELEEDETPGDGPKKDVLFKLHEELAQFFQRCLLQVKSGEAARKYLKEREITEDVIKDFLIGYAPKGWDNMSKWGRKHKYSEEILEAAGVILKSTKPEAKGKYYDRFRDRLIFPVRDIQGRVIGFSGRIMQEDAKAAKYINSPETALFHKGRILYALDRARRNIVNAEQREAIVCEGQIDVIRCHQAGFVNAVAAQGTAFTEEHARVLHRYADSVVLVFDTDTAGQNAAIKTAQIFIEEGLAVRVAALPAGSDPDMFIRDKGAKSFGNILANARSAVVFQVDVLSSRENTGSEVGTMRTAKAVLETVSRSTSSVQQAKLIQEAAEKLNIPASALQDDLKKVQGSKFKVQSSSGEEPAAPKVLQGKPAEEVALCEHLVHVVDFPELGKLVGKYLPLSMISDRCCREVLEAALNTLKTGRTIDDELREFVDQTGELQSFSAGILEAPAKVRGREFSRADAVRDLILRIWSREKERERNRLRKSDDSHHQLQAKELTILLHHLRNWPEGSEAIEMELED